jgi:hypothetical protein
MLGSLVAIGLLTLAIAGFLSCEYYTLKTGVPTVASFPAARHKITGLLREHYAARAAGQTYTIIDLGSGGGQLCQKIARALPQAHVIGIELSYLPWLRSVLSQRLFGPRNARFLRVDFWSYNCAGADAVVLFLTGNILDRVSDKLRCELKPGAIIVTNDMKLSGGWTPIADDSAGLLKTPVLVYRQV